MMFSRHTGCTDQTMLSYCFICICLLLLLHFSTSFTDRDSIPHPLRHATHQSPVSASSPYRLSPLDNSVIALPTKEQLAWQRQEIAMLIHYNLATYLDPSKYDGCNSMVNLLPNATLFNPVLLNTDNWVQSMMDLGAKYATLVVKHNCGFVTFPTRATVTTTNNSTMRYNYSVLDSPMKNLDVVGEFVKSCQKANIGHGFYYSVVWNNFLRVSNGAISQDTWVAGQLNITIEEYNRVVATQLEELWRQYGSLTEVWFDGAYTNAQLPVLLALLEKFQPQAVVFNGCDTNGVCVSNNSVRWIGTESGQAPDPNWSMGTGNDGGSSTSPIFCPAECDTTLQQNDRWFWGPVPLRPLTELIDVYHNTVGRNCMLELDLTPDTNGLIPADQARRYKQFGDFIRSCYGSSIKPTSMSAGANGDYTLLFKQYPVSIDRIVLQEDQTHGQVIRSYQLFAKIVDRFNIGNTTLLSDIPYTFLHTGTSIGNKRIVLLSESFTIIALYVNTTFVDKPVMRDITVHLCDKITAAIEQD